jgi:hypothetical protein
MAHLYFDDTTRYGRILRNVLSTIETSDDLFTDVRDVMIQMRTGDGTDAAHYAVVATRFGFQNNADAKSAFEEIDSAYSKTSGNTPVSDVRAAREQLLARLR